MAKRSVKNKKRALKQAPNQNTLTEKNASGTRIYMGPQDIISVTPFIFKEPDNITSDPAKRYALSIMIALGITSRIKFPKKLFQSELPKIVSRFNELSEDDPQAQENRKALLNIIPLLEEEPLDASGFVSGGVFIQRYAHEYFDGTLKDETFSMILHCLPWLCMPVQTTWGIVAESYNMLSRTNYAISEKNKELFDECINSWAPTPPFDVEAIDYYNQMAKETGAPLFTIPKGAPLLDETEIIEADRAARAAESEE